MSRRSSRQNLKRRQRNWIGKRSVVSKFIQTALFIELPLKNTIEFQSGGKYPPTFFIIKQETVFASGEGVGTVEDRDWKQIKTEYITTDTSYRKLAKKHNIPMSTLTRIAIKEQWVEARERYKNKVVAKTVEKMANKEANKLAKIRTAADNMADVVTEIFDDPEQFHRHLVQVGVGKSFDTVERVYNKIDTKAIKDITATLKDLSAVLRNIYDLPTMQEQAAMDNAASRLRLDQEKAAIGKTDGDETGVVLLAPVEGDADG